MSAQSRDLERVSWALEVSSKPSILCQVAENVCLFRKQVFIIIDTVNHITFMMPSVTAVNTVSNSAKIVQQERVTFKLNFGLDWIQML